MPKIYFGEAFALLGKTMPFIWLRLGSYALLGLGLALYAGVMGGIAWLLGALWAPLGIIVFLVAIGGAFGVMRWASRYYFYLLQAAHTAVMTEYIVYGRAPTGSQVAYGRAQVTERFKNTSIMFGVNVLIDGTVKRFTRTFANIASILPIPGMDGLLKLFRRVALYASTYIDEAILSRAYKEREENVWKVARDGVILYAQAWKPVLANAAALALLSFVEFLLLLIILGLPAALLGAMMPAMRVPLGIFVLIGAWMIKLAVADAFSLAATLIAYHRATEGLTVNAEWQAKLENISDSFRELGQRAMNSRVPHVPTPSSLPETERPTRTA